MNGAEKQRHGITELRGARAWQRMLGKEWQGQRAVKQWQSAQCITLRGDGKAEL
jgi:hypothetical protein